MDETEAVYETEEQKNILEEQQRERDRIFADLEAYLEEFKTKKDEEGKPLVSFPKNFDKVTQSMSRKDLYSNDSSWSKCLLSSRFDDDLRHSSFEGGRYKALFEEEEGVMRVERGMAEIAMMDKQIHALNRKAAEINNVSSDALPASRHRISRSRKSSRNGGVFLTRQVDDSAATTPAQTPIGTPLGTARTTSDFEIESSDDEEALEATDNTELDEDMKQLMQREDEAIAITSIPEEETPEEVEVEEPASDDLRTAVRSVEEKELFLQALLNEDDDNVESSAAWKAIASYGFTDALRSRLEDIDAELEARFGMPSSTTSALVSDQEAVSTTVNEPRNYLLEQRAKRLRDAYSSQINTLLHSFSTPSDLSGLLVGIDSGASSSGTRSVLSLPAIDEIQPERLVTTNDITAAIHELQQHNSSGKGNVSRDQVNSLLRKHREDITRLSSMRTAAAVRVGPASVDSSIDTNYIASMAQYEQEYGDDEGTNDFTDMVPEPTATNASEIFTRLQFLMAARHSSNSEVPPPLARMTAAELKEAKNNESINVSAGATDPPPTATPTGAVIFKHHKRVVENVELDLEAMHDRLERILQRATSCTSGTQDDAQPDEVVEDVMRCLIASTETHHEDGEVQQQQEEKEKRKQNKRIII